VTEKTRVPAGVDVRKPHAARVYDYALGGKDNYAADRALIDKLTAIIPDTPLVAQENRAFLGRAVHFLARAGIRQFLDIGTGLPTQGNVHEVAQEVAPGASVVYVDYDPIVLAHSRELLSGTDSAIVIQGDVRRPDDIVGDPRVRKVIDFEEPVAVLLVGLLHLVAESDDPAAIVGRLRAAVPSGSYLVICQITGDHQTHDAVVQWKELFGGMAEPMVPRTHEEVGRFFEGMELVEPGLVKAWEWCPDEPGGIPSPRTDWLLGGVARKP
jgi:S-adenosyl methyltransferase